MYYMVYGISDCPSCLRACALLMENDIEYAVIEMDFSKQCMRATKTQFNSTTFPIIVMVSDQNTTVIGGYEALVEHLSTPSEQ